MTLLNGLAYWHLVFYLTEAECCDFGVITHSRLS
jgi:hypothetical protein